MKLRIDDEGFPCFGETRISDPAIGQQIFKNLNKDQKFLWHTQINNTDYLIEVFDQPLIVQNLEIPKNFTGTLLLQMPFESYFHADVSQWKVDQWDRFHGRTTSGLPFVLTRKAQVQIFELAEEFSDESFTIQGIEILTPSLWEESQKSESQNWDQRYHESDTPWDIGQSHPAFRDLMPRLKLSKCRVLVLGCGNGHDAAFMAQNGHHVTAVDISEQALLNAKNKYSDLNIDWVCHDIFNLPKDFHQSFDLILEHTCFCAIPPEKRSDLVKIWNQCLIPTGYLLGVFFLMDKPEGPPFGGSEWEYRQRLKDKFHFLFWGRPDDINSSSLQGRQFKELLVFAQKKD